MDLENLRTWKQIVTTDELDNQFLVEDEIWLPILHAIGMTATTAWASLLFDYSDAKSIYDNYELGLLFRVVNQEMYLKYQKLIDAANAEFEPIENYNMIEESTDTRTPNLSTALTKNTTTAMTDTRSTFVAASSSSTSAINQTKTITDNPNSYTDTTTHKVNPYDDPGLKTEYQDESVQTGSRATTEAYSGDPDTTSNSGTSTTTNSGGTSTTNTGTDTQTQTGTDTNYHVLTRKGNIGITTSQQMLESQIALADKMDFWRMIENDIANKIFLQVW